jgi:hypothetical protein
VTQNESTTSDEASAAFHDHLERLQDRPSPEGQHLRRPKGYGNQKVFYGSHFPCKPFKFESLMTYKITSNESTFCGRHTVKRELNRIVNFGIKTNFQRRSVSMGTPSPSCSHARSQTGPQGRQGDRPALQSKGLSHAVILRCRSHHPRRLV